MIWIISGPSSAGKSTFLASERCRELTGCTGAMSIRYGFESELSDEELEGSLIHYNILRPFLQFRKSQARERSWFESLRNRFKPKPDATDWQGVAENFSADPMWQRISGLEVARRAIVLVAGRDEIIDRVGKRTRIEERMPGNRSNTYSAGEWLEIYAKVDLPALYRAWLRDLTSRGIEYQLIDSGDLEFREMSSL